MISKKTIFKQTKLLVVFLAFAVASPVILAKLGFWSNSEASSAAAPSATPSTQRQPYSYADAIAKAAPAVVSIHSSREIPKEMQSIMRDPFYRYFFGDQRGQIPNEIQSGIGSGVIVTKDGFVLTNNHVVNEASDIKVKLSDGRTAQAKIIGSDADTDLAILKIDLKDLPVVQLGDSEKIRVGDIVFAIGNPFGVGQTVTQGIISATHRQDLGISAFENFIQTDAAINPGNSGGALIDANGNLIGINNAIYTRTGGYQGIGFAIPISLAQDIMNELMNVGHITRGWLGITVQHLTEESRKSLQYPKGEGALVAGVIRNGPAFNSGLRPGDVIITVDNKEIKNPSDVLNITAKLKPDTAYPLSVIRNGETLDFRVVVGKRPIKTMRENLQEEPKK